MRDVLIFYATSEGQTRRIAERIAKDIGARGLDARAIDVTSADAADVVWDNVQGGCLARQSMPATISAPPLASRGVIAIA